MGAAELPAPTPTLLPSWTVDISFKDDVTVILRLDISFVCKHLQFSQGFLFEWKINLFQFQILFFEEKKFGETFPLFIFLLKPLKIANKSQSEYYFSQKGLDGCKLWKKLALVKAKEALNM